MAQTTTQALLQPLATLLHANRCSKHNGAVPALKGWYFMPGLITDTGSHLRDLIPFAMQAGSQRLAGAESTHHHAIMW